MNTGRHWPVDMRIYVCMCGGEECTLLLAHCSLFTCTFHTFFQALECQCVVHGTHSEMLTTVAVFCYNSSFAPCHASPACDEESLSHSGYCCFPSQVRRPTSGKGWLLVRLRCIEQNGLKLITKLCVLLHICIVHELYKIHCHSVTIFTQQGAQVHSHCGGESGSQPTTMRGCHTLVAAY